MGTPIRVPFKNLLNIAYGFLPVTCLVTKNNSNIAIIYGLAGAGSSRSDLFITESIVCTPTKEYLDAFRIK